MIKRISHDSEFESPIETGESVFLFIVKTNNVDCCGCMLWLLHLIFRCVCSAYYFISCYTDLKENDAKNILGL